jgi:hypothetical protein
MKRIVICGLIAGLFAFASDIEAGGSKGSSCGHGAQEAQRAHMNQHRHENMDQGGAHHADQKHGKRHAKRCGKQCPGPCHPEKASAGNPLHRAWSGGEVSDLVLD